MIIMRLKGGMGNQMFQYAMGMKLAQMSNTKLRLDLSSLLDRSKGNFVYRDYDLSVFNVKDEFVISPRLLKAIYKVKSAKIRKVVHSNIAKKRKVIKEEDFHFQPSLLSNADINTLYEGWFQSPKYFEGIEDQLRQQFSFKNEILPRSTTLLREIQHTNSICLNVRRTDFLKVDNLNTTDLSYFANAAKYIGSKVQDPTFFIFSDDIHWCRRNIVLDYPIHIVGHQHKGHKFSNYLQLMTHCKHFIIPNSSFAWWAVWLNDNSERIVVAPKRWFNDPKIVTSDLIPDEWIRM